MKIICAGFPKTGTKSMAAALKILGFTVVHDFEEHMEYYMDEYIQAYHGIMPDFGAMYFNVDATLDMPACFFWEEMKQSFPDAKVILMERDNVESWLKSMLHTEALWQEIMATKVWARFGLLITPTGRKWKKYDDEFVKKMKFEKGEEVPSEVYLEHNARVKATIPRDDLLVFNVKQGWKPLCEFLGVEVPDVPFPRLNLNSNVIPDLINHSTVGNRVFKELSLILAMLLAVLAILIFMIVT